MIQRSVAEIIGTFALVFCGTGAIIIDNVTKGGVSHVGVAITFGLVVMAMIYGLGDVSGAHLNPAVSIAFMLAGRLPLKSLGIYVASEIVGAFLASLTLRLLFPTDELLGSTYLRTLPAHIRVEFQLNQDKLNLLLAHGSPRRINEYLFEDREEKSMLRILQDADADILCFGHTHQPYHRILPSLPDTPPHYRHAVNIGSVGKPKDGDPRGCYVVLQIGENSSVHDKESIQVEFVRFSYDVEKAARAVEHSPLPNVFAQALRTA